MSLSLSRVLLHHVWSGDAAWDGPVFPFSARRDTMMFILGLMNKGNGKRDSLDALRPLRDLHRAWEKRRHPDRLGTLFLKYFFLAFFFALSDQKEMTFRSLVR